VGLAPATRWANGTPERHWWLWSHCGKSVEADDKTVFHQQRETLTRWRRCATPTRDVSRVASWSRPEQQPRLHSRASVDHQQRHQHLTTAKKIPADRAGHVPPILPSRLHRRLAVFIQAIQIFKYSVSPTPRRRTTCASCSRRSAGRTLVDSMRGTPRRTHRAGGSSRAGQSGRREPKHTRSATVIARMLPNQLRGSPGHHAPRLSRLRGLDMLPTPR